MYWKTTVLSALIGMLTALVFMLICEVSKGSENLWKPYDGWISPHGYKYDSSIGGFWKNGLVYERYLSKRKVCKSTCYGKCNCRYQEVFKYRLAPERALNSKIPNFLDTWASMAARMKEKTETFSQYMQAAKMYGLEGSLRSNSTYNPYNQTYMQQQPQQYQPNAQQGSSVYGYPNAVQQYSQFDLYGTRRLDKLINAHARGYEASQGLSEQIADRTSSLIQEQNIGNENLLTIREQANLLRVKAETDAQMLRNVGLQKETYSQTTITPQIAEDGEQGINLMGAINQVLHTHCAKCHSDDKQVGQGEMFPNGFSIGAYATYNKPQRTKVAEVVREGRMPKVVDGQQPLQLTMEELQALIQGSMVP